MALSFGLILSGCVTEPDITQDPDFGQSVRQTIAIQTADPWAGAPGLDGQKASAVLRTYRQQVADPRAVEREIEFDVR
jgi:hypothetical protein